MNDGVEWDIIKGANGIYNIGDVLNVTATVDQDCCLTLLDIGSSGNIIVLFPNKHQPDNHLRAGIPIQIPAAGYKIRVGGPAGTETIKAIATLEPLEFSELSMADVQAIFNALDGSGSGTFTHSLTSKDLFIEPEPAVGWAEASVHFRVTPEKLYSGERSVLELSNLE